MNPQAAKRLRLLASVVSILVVVAIGTAAWFYSRVRASLPELEGTEKLPGLSAKVTIERDALGVPTVRGENRVDVARALGFLHGQDRFFQMDVLRRVSAGELAALFGQRGVVLDRARRIHDFRTRARLTVAALPAADRVLIDAYTAGVNAGLSSLGARPFEYLVLRDSPLPWLAEDSFLVAYSMAIDLQDPTARYEKTLMTLRDVLGYDGLAFFAPLVGPNDAALDGSIAPLPAVPGPKMLDLRQKTARTTRRLPGGYPPGALSGEKADLTPGSNAFALSGGHTATGAGLLANDMHLDHGMPNIWYRAVLTWNDSASAGAATASNGVRRIAGVTLPGLPLIVAGSNGRVAWGLTASLADLADLVIVESSGGLSNYYAVPGDKAEKFENRTEAIRVKGSADVTLEYQRTIWGPVVGKDDRGRPLALRWVMHEPGAIDLGFRAMEDATDVAGGLASAQSAGMPTINVLVADAAGSIGWTIGGRLPKRVGYDGRLPVSWAYGDRKWDGLLPPADVPKVVQAKTPGDTVAAGATAGRLWSANHRQVGGDDLAKIGDGGYSRPARASQIRDGLKPLEQATPADLLKVQLDDRALFLTPWHELLMQTLSPEVVAGKSARAGLRTFAEKWEGRASVDSISYPIAKQFRLAVRARIFQPIFAACLEASPEFDGSRVATEAASWAILQAKPLHLLDPQFATWDELLVAAADDTIAFLDKQAITMPQATWGRRNRAEIRHVFSYSMPDWVTGWLRMPADPLPGDVDMPRVQAPRHGASERFVVTPGREEEGIFHMPGGQSGHPLSPYFSAGHSAWVKGEPTPFLPGKTEHTLLLVP